MQLTQSYFNDRLNITVGGNVSSIETSENSGTFFGNDFAIEYSLNKDRSLNLRVFQQLEPDIAGGYKLDVGTGIGFRKEFNSFAEFWKSIGKKSKKKKKQEEKNEQAN